MTPETGGDCPESGDRPGGTVGTVTLVRIPGPFDDRPGTGAAPATPTCCCCCCLVTTLTGGTVAALKVHREAELAGKERQARVGATVVAAVTVVLIIPLIYLLAAIDDLLTPTITSPGWLLVILFVVAVMGTWMLWLRLAFRLADAPGFGAWKWSGLFAFAAGLAFTAEALTLGFFIYGQLASIPIAVGTGISYRRRLKSQG